MKKIILMRHAKSDWTGNINDFERPLNSRGMKAAPEMGRFFVAKNIIPDLIMSSPANRAKTTAQLVAKACNYSAEIIFHEGFYFGYTSEILDSIRKINENTKILFLFGHNPTWEMLVGKLSGVGLNMPSASAAILTFDADWKNLSDHSCQFVEHIRPKDLI